MRLDRLRRDDPGGFVLVAELRGEIVGLLTAHVTPVLHRPSAVGRITALVVTASARGSGAGRALVNEAERRFAQHGLARVELTSAESHREAHGFYRRLGYADAGVRLAKPLAPRG